MNLSHREAQRALHAVLDGQASARLKMALEQHLAVCADCQRAAEKLNALDDRLAQSLQRRWHLPAPSERKVSAALARIPPQTRKPSGFVRSARSAAWVALTIALLLVLIWGIRTFVPQPMPAAVPTLQLPVIVPTMTPTTEPTRVPTPTVTVTKIKIIVPTSGGYWVHWNQWPDDFNKSHTDIQIEFQGFEIFEFASKFKEDQKSENPADMTLDLPVGGMAAIDTDWVDLTPYIQADNFDMSRFHSKSIEMFTYPGKGIISLPMCIYPEVIYYNADLFDAAGVAYPPHKYGEKYADGSAWTYDTLVEVAKKLTLDANGNNASNPAFDDQNIKQFGYVGFNYMVISNLAQKFGAENGIGVSQDMKTAVFDTQPYINAMEFIKKSVWEWHIHPSEYQLKVISRNQNEPFSSGKIAMMEVQNWYGILFSDYADWEGKFKWNIAAIPAGPNGKVIDVTDANSFYIPQTSKHPREAWEVAKWFFQHDNLKRYTDEGLCLPGDKILATEWLASRKSKYPNVDWQVMIDSLDYPDIPNHELGNTWLGPLELIGNACNINLSDPNFDAIACLNAGQAIAQAALDEWWKNH